MNHSCVSFAVAAAIMGANFVGPEIALERFKLTAPEAIAAEVPYSEKMLQAHKDDCVLVLVPPISMGEMRSAVEIYRPKGAQRPESQYFSEASEWVDYQKQAFAAHRGEWSWCLVSKTVLADSAGKKWGECQLPMNVRLVNMQILIYSMLTYCIKTGTRLFEKTWVCTTDVPSATEHREDHPKRFHLTARFRSKHDDPKALIGISNTDNNTSNEGLAFMYTAA